MRHLFIINPIAKRIKGKVELIKEKLLNFLKEYPQIEYDIYVTEWCRDSVMFIQRYITGKDETVRVHAIGGTGLMFEVVNSVIGLPNVEVASHPYGKANSFLKYFGRKNEKLFLSLKSQVFDRTVPMDVIRIGHSYGICYGKAGIEAHANVMGGKWIDKGMPVDISYLISGIKMILSGKAGQNYSIEIDGNEIEGDFISVMVANTPCYGIRMNPAVDAHPNDGMLDVYVFKNAMKTTLLKSVPTYIYGNYRKLPNLVTHYTAKKVKMSSDTIMRLSIDGEAFYRTTIEYEIMPNAIQFVCPSGINLAKLPRIYGKPKEGFR